MKKINTSPITSTVGLPIKSGTLNHLQEAYREIVESAVRSLIGNAYSTGSFYKLYGCENTGSGSNYIISAGAIFYNGEIYLVDAATFTAAGGEVAVGTITTTNILAANADPVTLTNSTTANVHEVRKIVFASGVAGSSDVNFSALVGYIQSENYKDISAQVSVAAGLTVINKSVRRYSDGTVSVNIVLSYSSNITADTNIITGLPLGQYYSYVSVPVYLYKSTPAYLHSNLVFASFLGVVSNDATINHGTYDTLSIAFDYKTRYL